MNPYNTDKWSTKFAKEHEMLMLGVYFIISVACVWFVMYAMQAQGWFAHVNDCPTAAYQGNSNPTQQDCNEADPNRSGQAN